MQNNILFKQMYNEIKEAHYILIISNKNTSADTLCCSLSLSNYFHENKIKHHMYNISEELPRKFDFLSRYNKISKNLPKYYDLIIYVDCECEYQVGYEFLKDIKSISIDHDQLNNKFADLNIIDHSKTSTVELLYYFFKINELNISKNMAECLYAGIYDESIGFTTKDTDYRTFNAISDLVMCNINISSISDKLHKRDSLARFRVLPKIMDTLELFSEGKLGVVYLEETWLNETGAKINECDDIVDMVLSIGIVNIVAYFRVVNNKVNCSLRSKGEVDASLIARKFNGGGDKNSAGISISFNSFEATRKEIVNVILDYI